MRIFTPMLNPDEALELIFRHTRPLEKEGAAPDVCAGRVLAEDVSAILDLPSFDNSAMDGYAVRCADMKDASTETPAILEIQNTVKAGAARPPALEPGRAARILTGAPVPDGADAVVPQELCLLDQEGRRLVSKPPEAGDNIRRAGEDVKGGELLLKKGTLLRPYEAALLAAQGMTLVPVVRKPRIKVLATGDELAEPGAVPEFGKIINSNGPAMTAALRRWGLEAAHSTVGDDRAALAAALKRDLENHDVVIVSGGVSVGDFDHTQEAVKDVGAEIIFWKTAIKPGKPLLFAVLRREKTARLLFGIPGNPVSALVCLEEFVRPALENLQGRRARHPGYHMKGRVLKNYFKPADRRQYIFCRALQNAEGFDLDILRPQGSAMLGMACRADALAIGPLGVSKIKEGDSLWFRWLK